MTGLKRKPLRRTALKRHKPPRSPRKPNPGQDFNRLPKARQRAYCLALWGKVVVARDAKCFSGRDKHSGPLVGHHILRKGSHRGVSLNLDNGLTLCQGCHFWVHQYLDDYQGWHIERIGGGTWSKLLVADSMAVGKHPDYGAIRLFLEQQLEKMKDAHSYRA